MLYYNNYVNSNIHISKAFLDKLGYDAEEKFREEFKKRLGIMNPAWVTKSRFSRWGGWKASTEKYIYFFKETPTHFVIPRNYDLVFKDGENYKLNFEDKTIQGRKTNYAFTKKLWNYQQDYFTDFPLLQVLPDKVMNAGCGSGKTVLGIFLAHFYSVASLVLVPTNILAKQWVKRIEEFTTASYFVWTSETKEIPLGKDFYIISFDLFTLRELPKKWLNQIGHVLLDEGHRMGAQTYIPILNMIPAAKRTALTATFRRNDGMHMILRNHFGDVFRMNYEMPRPVVYEVEMNNKVGYVFSKKGNWQKLSAFLESLDVKVRETKTCIEFPWDEYRYKKVIAKMPKGSEKNSIRNLINLAARQSYVTLDTFLAEQDCRRQKIVDIIQECMNAGRTVLFLSKRKNSLKEYCAYFKKYKPVLIVSKSTDKMTESENEYLQKYCKLIFGIKQLANEGLDVPRTDTVIFEQPVKDTEQPIGRSARELPLFYGYPYFRMGLPGKRSSVILYLSDENDMCQGLLKASQRYIIINAKMGPAIKWNKIKNIL